MNNKYIVLRPTQHQTGIFAFLWQSLRGIYHNPYQYYYFYFGKESCYFDGTVEGFNNVWDYYYKQPFTNTFPTVIEKEVGLIFDQISEFREGEDYGLTTEEYNHRRFIFNSILNSYFELLPHMTEKIDSFWNTNMANKTILGIHCRGTDHPNNADLSKYLDQIEQISSDYDCIFAMSDEQGKIDILRERFGSKLITYDTFRSTNGAPLWHTSFAPIHNPRLIGEEALIESYLMARTAHLLFYTGSNVNFFIRALNPFLPYTLLK